MIPVMCRIPHRPEENKYGDCMRACVASILELDANDVPNFVEDDASGDLMFARLREFLASRKLIPITVGFPGAAGFAEVMNGNAQLNPGVYSLFFCDNGSGDHCVVVKAGKVVHDPAWGGKHSVYQPHSDGIYGFVFFGALL